MKKIVRQAVEVFITPTVNAIEHCETPDKVVHDGPGALHKAARHLIAEGYDPKRRMNVVRGIVVVLSGTIHAFAIQTWGGNAKDPSPARWRPMPMDPLPPRLAAWHARNEKARGVVR